jgi:signal peptide peptidase SppA
MKPLSIKADTSAWNQLWAMEKRTLETALARRSTSANKEKPSPQTEEIQTVSQASQPSGYAMNGPTAVIPIVGPISKYPSILDAIFGGVSTLEIQEEIEGAINDDAVESIVLFIDSPGGTVAGTSDLADYIRTAKTLKPITAYVSDHCFSAAYWIAAQCTRIIANEGAFVGSIGVYSVLVDSSQAAAAAGLQFSLIAAGEYKGLLEDGIPLDQKAFAETQRQVNAAYQLFLQNISEGRNWNINEVMRLGDGRVHIASEALKLNLINGIGSIESAMSQEGNEMDKTKVADANDSAPVDEDAVLKQILAAIQALSEKFDDFAGDDDEDTADGSPDNADDSSDDTEAKTKAAVAEDRDRLKAINDSCPGRAEFVVAQFLAGKSAIEAKAALADILHTENANLKKQVKHEVDGVEPLALGGPVETSNDPETIWKENIGGVQAMYSGKKEYYLNALKHKKAPTVVKGK